MLIFRTYDDEARVITYYEPFACLNWIFILFGKAIQTVREAVELAHQGRTVQIEFECIKESFVPAGKLDEPLSHQITKTTSLPPIVSRILYEDMADYCEAKARQ
jgi:hypothetical protein